MSETVRPWLLLRLAAVANRQKGADHDVDDLPPVRGNRVQVIKFLTYRTEADPHAQIWAEISDRRHWVLCVFDREAVDQFERLDPSRRLTSTRGGVLLLHYVSLHIGPFPLPVLLSLYPRAAPSDFSTHPALRQMLVAPRLVVRVRAFRLLGSVGEPIWGKPVHLERVGRPPLELPGDGTSAAQPGEEEEKEKDEDEDEFEERKAAGRTLYEWWTAIAKQQIRLSLSRSSVTETGTRHGQNGGRAGPIGSGSNERLAPGHGAAEAATAMPTDTATTAGVVPGRPSSPQPVALSGATESPRLPTTAQRIRTRPQHESSPPHDERSASGRTTAAGDAGDGSFFKSLPTSTFSSIDSAAATSSTPALHSSTAQPADAQEAAPPKAAKEVGQEARGRANVSSVVLVPSQEAVEEEAVEEEEEGKRKSKSDAQEKGRKEAERSPRNESNRLQGQDAPPAPADGVRRGVRMKEPWERKEAGKGLSKRAAKRMKKEAGKGLSRRAGKRLKKVTRWPLHPGWGRMTSLTDADFVVPEDQQRLLAEAGGSFLGVVTSSTGGQVQVQAAGHKLTLSTGTPLSHLVWDGTDWYDRRVKSSSPTGAHGPNPSRQRDGADVDKGATIRGDDPLSLAEFRSQPSSSEAPSGSRKRKVSPDVEVADGGEEEEADGSGEEGTDGSGEEGTDVDDASESGLSDYERAQRQTRGARRAKGDADEPSLNAHATSGGGRRESKESTRRTVTTTSFYPLDSSSSPPPMQPHSSGASSSG